MKSLLLLLTACCIARANNIKVEMDNVIYKHDHLVKLCKLHKALIKLIAHGDRQVALNDVTITDTELSSFISQLQFILVSKNQMSLPESDLTQLQQQITSLRERITDADQFTDEELINCFLILNSTLQQQDSNSEQIEQDIKKLKQYQREAASSNILGYQLYLIELHNTPDNQQLATSIISELNSNPKKIHELSAKHSIHISKDSETGLGYYHECVMPAELLEYLKTQSVPAVYKTERDDKILIYFVKRKVTTHSNMQAFITVANPMQKETSSQLKNSDIKLHV